MNLLRTQHARRATNDTRTGTVLVLFAVLVFALLGIAALTVDIGFATLSQAQMQTAADTAALEGVRLRDFHEYRPLSDRYRRARVSELVQDVNDDDMHPTGGVPASLEGISEQPADDADTLRLGAGPVIRLSGGIGSANASALIETPDFDSLTGTDAWVDDPRLEVNRRNVANGDMLSGTFQRFASHAEDESYTREDFTPALWVGTDQSESFRALGFLVRMRRTTGENALDEVPLIATRGPSLPFLFGMGTSIHAASGEYDPRRDGITTRATAIAAGRPALRIGPPPLQANGQPIVDRTGVRPTRGVGSWWFPNGTGTPQAVLQRRHFCVVLAKSFWSNDVPSDDYSAPIYVRDDGRIEYQRPGFPIEIVGHLVVSPCDQSSASSTCPGVVARSVGELVGSDLSAAPYSLTPSQIQGLVQSIGTTRGYIAIYTGIASASGVEKRIVGYGYCDLAGASGGVVTVKKGWQNQDDSSACQVTVAPDNASASLGRNSPALSREQWNAVFEQNIQFVYPSGAPSYRWQDIRPGTALAPALVR